MIFKVKIIKFLKWGLGTPSRIPSLKRSNLAHLSHCPAIFFSRVATLITILCQCPSQYSWEILINAELQTHIQDDNLFNQCKPSHSLDVQQDWYRCTTLEG